MQNSHSLLRSSYCFALFVTILAQDLSLYFWLCIFLNELILYCRFCSEVDDDNHYIGKHCTDCISTFKNTNILPDLSFFGRLLFTLPHLWSHWSIIITAAEQRSDCIRGSRTLLLLLLGRKLWWWDYFWWQWVLTHLQLKTVWNPKSILQYQIF